MYIVKNWSCVFIISFKEWQIIKPKVTNRRPAWTYVQGWSVDNKAETGTEGFLPNPEPDFQEPQFAVSRIAQKKSFSGVVKIVNWFINSKKWAYANVVLKQCSPMLKKYSPQMWQLERLCRHICWKSIFNDW